MGEKKTEQEIREIIAGWVDAYIKTLEDSGMIFVDEDHPEYTQEENKAHMRTIMIEEIRAPII